MSKKRIAVIATLGALTILLVTFVATTAGLASFGAISQGARLERIRKSKHFDGTIFVNSVPTHNLIPGTLGQMLRHQFFGDEQRTPPKAIPVVMRTTADYATQPSSGLRATWIGHASVLLEVDGARVLTDPVFAERASPSTIAGPIRFHPPPIALDALPTIDVVVISHDHFDHLDMATVKALAAKGTHFGVPLGIGAHLEQWGVPLAAIHELEWGESFALAGLTLTSTPARHYSGRNPLKTNRALWSSWAIVSQSHRVFFSGDSGYFDGFAKIGEQFGPFDLTLIKVGASDPTWIEIHMSPQQAVQAHLDLKGKLLLPVHWGTFNLAFHDWNQPAEVVTAEATRKKANIIIPRPGQWVEPSSPPNSEPWWRL